MRTDTVEIYKSKRLLAKRTQWRWRYLRSNGKKLADSAESYANMDDLLGSLATVLGVPRTDLINTTVMGGRVASVLVPRGENAAVHVIIKR
jgi:uncharacterized protein YegP (UPF0339 family)